MIKVEYVNEKMGAYKEIDCTLKQGLKLLDAEYKEMKKGQSRWASCNITIKNINCNVY